MERITLLELGMTREQTRVADFEELYVTYLPKVYNYVRCRVGDRQTAEDITAEVFERVLRKFSSYQVDRGAFSSWLFRIAHNVVANYLRAQKRQPETRSLEDLPLTATTQSPEQAMLEEEELQRLLRCMRRLPVKQQEALILKFSCNMDNQEIAQALRSTPNHVGVLLYRAVRALRLALQEEE